MKKLLLFSIAFLVFTITVVYAYETVIIKFPDGELWNKVYYKKFGNEAILQYVPNGQTKDSWKRAIIVHSYNHSPYRVRDLAQASISRMLKVNPLGKYRYLKNTDVDIIANRCTQDYKDITAQCEIFRVTRAHGGIITLHYINKDRDDFIENYYQWYNIIKLAIFYNTYYRDERTLDKSQYFEL